MEFPRILVVKTGSAHPAVVQAMGDYDDWFARGFTGGLDRCDVVSAWKGQTLPMPHGYGGMLITGSSLSVREEAPWMAGLARWALAAADVGIPVLGVCFGHQLLGEALGGRVERNPRGGEYGTISVNLTDEGRRDPLFEGLGDTLEVQATHEDALVRPPTAYGAVRLAGNANTAVQAFGAGPYLRAVQFHPEMSAEILALKLEVSGVQAETWPSPHGLRVLRNWDRHWVRREG